MDQSGIKLSPKSDELNEENKSKKNNKLSEKEKKIKERT